MFTVHVIDWGDVPTWIGAITTSLALIAAGAVVRIELRRDKRADDAREREEAEKVAVWHEDTRSSGLPIPQMVLRNGSSLPIYRTIVNIRSGGQSVHYPLRQVIPPGQIALDYPSDVRPVQGDTHLQLWFIDSAGQGWQRGFNGQLRRLSEDEQSNVIGIRLSTEPGATKRRN